MNLYLQAPADRRRRFCEVTGRIRTSHSPPCLICHALSSLAALEEGALGKRVKERKHKG